MTILNAKELHNIFGGGNLNTGIPNYIRTYLKKIISFFR